MTTADLFADAAAPDATQDVPIHPSAEAAGLSGFRLQRLEVLNWGTFSGLHEVPIAERGFLFVGRSGSGKTTLLDAMSALLVPPALAGLLMRPPPMAWLVQPAWLLGAKVVPLNLYTGHSGASL